MATLVMEREFRRPYSAADMQAAAELSRSCLELYGVRPRRHYLSLDGMRCTCVFEAPDAEAVRNVIRASGFGHPKQLWSSTVYPAPGEAAEGPPILRQTAFALALVDRTFDEPVTYEDIQAQENPQCLEMHRVRFLRSYFSADRKRMMCVYEAPDVEAVRIANRQAGLPFDVAWGAELIISG